MRKLLLSIAILSLAGCGSEAPKETAKADEEAPVERPAMEAIDLAGTWNLVGFGTEGIPETVKMTVSATPDTLTVRSGCATMSWPYTINGNIIDTGEGSGDQSGCAGDRTTWEYSVGKIVRDANIVMNAGDGQVSLSGPGGSMTLAKAG